MELAADQNQKPAAKMLISSISNRKLHCCFLLLILFILVILSLPLFWIYIENDEYQTLHEGKNQFPLSSLQGSSSIQDEEIATATATNRSSSSIKFRLESLHANDNNNNNSNTSSTNDLVAQREFSSGEQPTAIVTAGDNQRPINCTQFAIRNNLTLANEDFQCPASSYPNRCRSCPRLCIEQRWNCDGKKDCPDGSDEGYCHDSTGAAGVIFENIFTVSKSKTTDSSLFKPESCTMEAFIEERCPCVFNDSRVVICENLALTHIPDDLKRSVFKIKMSNNSISNIDQVQWPSALSTLVLENNTITHIGPRTFESVPHLKLLFLHHNQIAYFDLDALMGLNQLTWLQMEANKLETFESAALTHTPNIAKLYLSENMIDLPDDTRFDLCCQRLRELLLDHNRITKISQNWFSNLTSLMWLSLSHNEISHIDDSSFDWNFSLEELNLSFNKIKTINSNIFANNLGIKRLHLSNNPLTSLPKDAFRELQRLQSLNLTDVYFDYIEKETFAGLELDFIYFARFRYCHYASHARVCLPLTDGLSSTQELLVFPILKAAVRIVALVCCLGNVFVFIWRSVSPHEHYTLSLFVRNLSIADLMMGIYLAAIGYKDWQFQEQGFRPHAIEWMSSGACTTIGFIAILSSELSVFVITIITIERYRSIISTNIMEEEGQEKRRARIYLLVAWILSFLIASYPLLEWLLSNSDFYATNGLCLPLHIDQPFMPGWQYSAIIYLGINFAALLIIIYLYLRMYAKIMQARQQATPFGAMKREDAILATRFFFIVIIDCLCWIPIVVIKIMALANVSIPSSIYGWLVVFIIPINSALNPIVYTLAAPTSMRAAICRWFKRACDNFDRLTTRTKSSRYSSHSSASSCESTTANGGGGVGSGGPGGGAGLINGFRRRNTGSTNSVTFDTFDTSIITCNSKRSVESALIQYDCSSIKTNAADKYPTDETKQQQQQQQQQQQLVVVTNTKTPPILPAFDLIQPASNQHISLDEEKLEAEREAMLPISPYNHRKHSIHHQQRHHHHQHQQQQQQQHKNKKTCVYSAVKSETLTPSSLDLVEYCRKPMIDGVNISSGGGSRGNKQQLQEPADMIVSASITMNNRNNENKLDSFSNSYRRRRQFAASANAMMSPKASHSFNSTISSSSTNSINSSTVTSTSAIISANSSTCENKLNNNRADYLSTYVDNTVVAVGAAPATPAETIDNGVGLLLIDKMSDSSTSSSGGGISRENDSPLNSSNKQQYRRLTRLVNNITDDIVHTVNDPHQPYVSRHTIQHLPVYQQQQHHHQVLVQARPDGNNTSGLIKELDPLQPCRRSSTMDLSSAESLLISSTGDHQQKQEHYPPAADANLQQRRFTDIIHQVSSNSNSTSNSNGSSSIRGGSIRIGMDLDDTTVSLSLLVPGCLAADKSQAQLSQLTSVNNNNNNNTTTSNSSGSKVSYNSSKNGQTCLLSGTDKCL